MKAPAPTRRAILLGAAVLSISGLANAQAADYPNKPVKLVVGYAAGGGADVFARVLAKELGESMGQPLVIENRPGASNNIAVESVARAAPDGYTLLLSAVTSSVNHTLYPNLKFDFLKDFEHVAKVAEGGYFLVVPTQLPVDTPSQLAQYIRSHPGQLSFASSGIGTSLHVTGEMFRVLGGGLDVVHVPYKGAAPALTDVIGGRVQYMFDNSSLPHIRSGKVKGLAVTTSQRSPHAPDIPTMIESGFPEFQSTWWYGVSAPAGTPAAIASKLNAALMKALEKDSLHRVVGQQLGTVPPPHAPGQFADFIKADVARWQRVLQAANVKLE